MKLNVLCVEMEAYALYLNAALAGKNALCLCTISDDASTGEGLTAEDVYVSEKVPFGFDYADSDSDGDSDGCSDSNARPGSSGGQRRNLGWRKCG